MPTFHYKAKQGPGKVIDGLIEANNLDNAITKIIQQGYSPIDVTQAEESQTRTRPRIIPAKIKKIRLFKKVRLSDIVVFTRQMADLIDAHVPMLQALYVVSHQTQNPEFKPVIEDMHKTVRDGGSFSDALDQHKDLFSPLYVNLVKTGEISGTLETALERLADFLEKEQETRSKVRASLAYPALILIVGIITVFVLLTFVIPRLTVMFEDLNQTLPLPTVILINISEFFSSFWWLIVAVIGIGIAYAQQWISTEKGREWLDTRILNFPLLGDFIKTVEIGRFSRTLATMVGSGVVITTALNSVWPTINNSVLQAELRDVSEKVKAGSGLKSALNECKFFPEIAVNMISVGEETGHLEKGLQKVADTYEKAADQTVKTIISLLGPLVLIGIVAIVGFVVLAMLLPIFQMNMTIQ